MSKDYRIDFIRKVEEILLGYLPGGPMNPGGIRYVLNVIAKRAGVDNVHPHRFRRTFATGLAARGMPIQEAQKILGHSNINTTLEYVCSDDEQVKRSYSKYAA